ncbi:P-loop containing nucleoside triphosphate hydrolase protein [Pavlovales sp. CCMP2436]|nr:P-loop containing nucleoside triphosphate hydrolase protein [Pavlovales sp. CCMP2436]
MLTYSRRTHAAARGESHNLGATLSLAQYDEQSATLQDEAATLSKQLETVEASAERLRKVPSLELLPKTVAALKHAHASWITAREHANALSAQLIELEAERQAAFESALAAANTRLSQTFGQLCVGGDAALELDAPVARATAAPLPDAEGNGDSPCARAANVELRVKARTRGEPWRAFTALSGGQQQLLSIAAQLALGESAQPPVQVLLLDEIDSALDSCNVTRVAELLRARQVQAICVSLRLQLVERGLSLTGVYPLGGSAHTVTMHIA